MTIKPEFFEREYNYTKGLMRNLEDYEELRARVEDKPQVAAAIDKLWQASPPLLNRGRLDALKNSDPALHREVMNAYSGFLKEKAGTQ